MLVFELNSLEPSKCDDRIALAQILAHLAGQDGLPWKDDYERLFHDRQNTSDAHLDAACKELAEIKLLHAETCCDNVASVFSAFFHDAQTSLDRDFNYETHRSAFDQYVSERVDKFKTQLWAWLDGPLFRR
jgi:hypothetical protein